MEIGLFLKKKYVSDENRVKASSPKQLEVRVRSNHSLRLYCLF